MNTKKFTSYKLELIKLNAIVTGQTANEILIAISKIYIPG